MGPLHCLHNGSLTTPNKIQNDVRVQHQREQLKTSPLCEVNIGNSQSCKAVKLKRQTQDGTSFPII